MGDWKADCSGHSLSLPALATLPSPDHCSLQEPHGSALAQSHQTEFTSISGMPKQQQSPSSLSLLVPCGTMPYPFARNTGPDLGGCLICGLAVGYTEHALYNPSGQASGEGVSLQSFLHLRGSHLAIQQTFIQGNHSS